MQPDKRDGSIASGCLTEVFKTHRKHAVGVQCRASHQRHKARHQVERDQQILLTLWNHINYNTSSLNQQSSSSYTTKNILEALKYKKEKGKSRTFFP